MATASFYLYVVAGLLLVGAFAAHVAHATLLATGHRLAEALAPRQTPAFAGVVGGSFVAEARRRPPTGADPGRGRPPRPSPSAWPGRRDPAGPGPAPAGDRGRRGTVGNMFESRSPSPSGSWPGYMLLERRYPVRSIGVVPLGVALGLFLYSLTLPAQIESLVPALCNPPLLTIHVGMAMISYGIFAMSFAAGWPPRPGEAPR